MALDQDLAKEWQTREKPPLPRSIRDNLKHKLRDYQIATLQNFIFYNENPPYKSHSPKHLLFHMATGSGKTIIIAGSLLYLYEKGYRDFIFLVNTTNIITKTKANLLISNSSKYLFQEKIIINHRLVTINQLRQTFAQSRESSINIYFTTTHKLHEDLTLSLGAGENKIALADCKNRKLVLLADEAHHLNSEFKVKKSLTDKKNIKSWGATAKKLLALNKENMLLEYTATAEIHHNPQIKKYYQEKIISEYPLKKFTADKYSKEIKVIKSDLADNLRMLEAVIISEGRTMIGEKHNSKIKPVILFKNPKGKKKIIANFLAFNQLIAHLTIKNIKNVFHSSSLFSIKNLKRK